MSDIEYEIENYEQICARLGVDDRNSTTWEAPAKRYVIDYLKLLIGHLESEKYPVIMNVEIPVKHDFKTVMTSFIITLSHPWGG